MKKQVETFCDKTEKKYSASHINYFFFRYTSETSLLNTQRWIITTNLGKKFSNENILLKDLSPNSFCTDAQNVSRIFNKFCDIR